MPDEFDISRRKALAALGAIGAASAGAGLGTSAYFSDQETFENNRLVAGTLDMGVGYSAHYADWLPNEQGTPEDDGVPNVRMWTGPAGTTGGAGDLGDDEVGFPANDAWLVAVSDDLDDGTPDTAVAEQFLENTQYQSYNDDGLDCVGGVANGQADGEERPVVHLDDVKPGDFGEVTFDFVLCDNPGFVWLNGSLRNASENGTTEPEADDPDEGEGVELLDVVRAAVWIDDGDNYQDGEALLVVDTLGEVLGMVDGGRLGTALNGDVLAPTGGGAAGARNCFSSTTRHSVVFAWWVPVDHGNEIQSDTASFDLGLYAEQCRHNDGTGMNDEAVAQPADFWFISGRDSEPDRLIFDLFRYDDGTETRVTDSAAIDEHPEPVGDRLFFTRTLDTEVDTPADRSHHQLFSMPIGGGPETQVTVRTDRFHSNGHPFAAPDGNTLFVTSKRTETAGGGEVIRRIDPDGTPVGPNDGIVVDHGASSGHSPTAVTDDGPRLFYASDHDGNEFDVYAADLDGSNEQRLTDDPTRYESGVAPSPDGSRLAFAREGPTDCSSNIWTMNPDGSDPVQVTNGTMGFRWAFTWIGTDRIVYVSDENGVNEIFAIRTDGTGKTRLVSGTEPNQHLLRDPNCDGFEMPELEMTGQPGVIAVGESVTFELRAEGGGDVDPFDEFDWRFDDNVAPVPETTTDDATTITHTYTDPGTYSTSVTAKISACTPASATVVPGPQIDVTPSRPGDGDEELNDEPQTGE
jgi:predicted ribosomally synthesized peptide with SipW-like signal peptide